MQSGSVYVSASTQEKVEAYKTERAALQVRACTEGLTDHEARREQVLGGRGATVVAVNMKQMSGGGRVSSLKG